VRGIVGETPNLAARCKAWLIRTPLSSPRAREGSSHRNPAEQEFRYVRHADVPRFTAEGWELLPALVGTHHGEYSVLMRRLEH
jgi:hypothetical protein